MLERGKMDRDLVEFVVIDQLVPKEHLLRKIDAAVDFTRLYEMVEPLYCEDNGRPSIDPVVLFKMVLIQHLYGLPSLRRTADEVSANNSTTNRDGYREYKSDPNICAACPTRERCTHSKNCIKTVQRHIWKDYEELADDARYTPAYAQLYKCRKETIERVFADAKEKHAMRYTQYRGLAQVTNWVKLKFVAMNLKKLATWKWRNLLSSFRFAVFSLIYVRDPVCS